VKKIILIHPAGGFPSRSHRLRCNSYRVFQLRLLFKDNSYAQALVESFRRYSIAFPCPHLSRTYWRCHGGSWPTCWPGETTLRRRRRRRRGLRGTSPDEHFRKLALYWATEKRLWDECPSLTDGGTTETERELPHVTRYRFVGASRYGDLPGRVRRNVRFLARETRPP